MTLCALFAALTAVGAFFKIPFALAAISLQFLFTAMAGVLLGAGGLTRAYAKSAKDALDAAGKARMRLWSAVTVDCPYPMLERLKLLAAAHGGTVEGTDFGAVVSVCILLPQENAAGFDAALTELSAGTMTARREGERFLPGPRE